MVAGPNQLLAPAIAGCLLPTPKDGQSEGWKDVVSRQVDQLVPISQFIQDETCLLLLVGYQEKTQTLQASNDLQPLLRSSSTSTDAEEDCLCWMAFTKAGNASLSQDNLRQTVQIQTLHANAPSFDFYRSLHNLFAPLLLRSGEKAGWIDSQLQGLLRDLDQGMTVALKDHSGNFQTLKEEEMYWAVRAKSRAGTGGSMDLQVFQQIKALAEAFGSLESVPIVDVLDVVDRAQDQLDDLWRTSNDAVYPKPRMIRLLETIGYTLKRFLETTLQTKDPQFWNQPFDSTIENLKCAVDICLRWEAVLHSLSTQFWPSCASHAWKATVSPMDCQAYAQKLRVRLQEVFIQITLLRSTVNQLARLLSQEDLAEFQATGTNFALFQGIPLLESNSFVDTQWKSACAKYYASLTNLQSRVAKRLGQHLSALRNHPFQLLHEVRRYNGVIRLDRVQKELLPERETLLAKLVEIVHAVRAELHQRTADPNSKNTQWLLPDKSPFVSQILWSKSNTERIAESVVIVRTSFADLPKSVDFLTLAGTLLSDMDSFEKAQHQEWLASVMLSMQNGALAVKATDRLLQLDAKNGHLRVNFNDELVSFIRDVSDMSSAGFPISSKLLGVVESTKTIYRHGIILKQIAHFYNTVDRQMIPSQQPMLLDLALAFENLIKNPKTAVSWNNVHDVESYVTQLQNAVKVLSSTNRYFRKQHEDIGGYVAKLLQTSLLRQQAKWKETLAEIRSILTRTQEEGNVQPARMMAWYLHWDHQLCKVLEFQWRKGVDAIQASQKEGGVLGSSFYDGEAELVYRNGQLQLRPALEDIRSKYYREMKKFLSIPLQFKGVNLGESANASAPLFANILESNTDVLSKLYQTTERVFQKLAKTTSSFQGWNVLPSSADLEQVVAEKLKTVADWETNFKFIKQKGKEAESIPSSIDVEGILISTQKMKTSIDDYLQRFFDALVSSLQKATHAHTTTIEEFIRKGTEVLAQKPRSISEIGEANRSHQLISAQLPSIQEHFEAIATKSKLLKQVAGSSGTLDMTSIKDRWDKFEILLESHQMMVKEQVDVMKAGITSRQDAFMAETEKFTNRWNQFRPRPDSVAEAAEAVKAIAYLKDQRAEVEELVEKSTAIGSEFTFFGLDAPLFSGLLALREEIARECESWLFLEQYQSEIQEYRSEDWIGFKSKTSKLEDFHAKWVNSTRQRLESGNRDTIAVHVQRRLDKLSEALPNLKYLRGDNWAPEHWGELFRLIGIHHVSLSELTVGHILDATESVVKCLLEIKALHNRAQGEITIRDGLQELEMWGASASFSFADSNSGGSGSKENTSLSLIKDWTELLNKIGDHRSLLQSLKESPYAKNFVDKIGIWDIRLNDLEYAVQTLNLIQRKWVYLFPIFEFGSGQALPNELPRFQRIDQDFRNVMQFVVRDPRVVRLLQFTNLRDTLTQLVDQLERCQKALTDYLEDKREKFARFYFIGDEDLLEILGQAKNPAVIQNHLKKLFAGVHSVEFSPDSQLILSITSAEGEVVKLLEPVPISGEVESWLRTLEVGIEATLKQQLVACYADFDVLRFPQQILDAVGRVHFTQRCESILTKPNINAELEAYKQELRTSLQRFTMFDLQQVSDTRERNVTHLKLKSLILDVIYFVDVLEQLSAESIASISDWSWQRQLRFYMARDGCEVRCGDAQFQYTFEYQGNPSKLVHTPLTDKCYLTLTQAMRDGFGGCPFGPAGTGKTESVKALGGIFGRMVLVFNCDEGLDYKSMGRIFTGIVRCGAWGCFDEFNRLEEIVLSAVSQQILAIQLALKGGQTNVNLIGRDAGLDPNSAIFVTLNPAGKGYGGRQKLPDNLKQLFRSIAMTTPDNEMIGQVLLLSEGYRFGKELGAKAAAVLEMCKQLLSEQQHYDWGLRALKAVLRLAGSLIQEKRRAGTEMDQAGEILLLVESLRLNTLPKLTSSDTRLFGDLLADVFPTVSASANLSQAFKEKLKESCGTLGLVAYEQQLDKAVQLHEALRQRMGVVVVGQAGSGKSTIIRLLRETLAKHQTLKVHTLNPKAMHRKVLLGHMDLDTREWFDGVLVAAARAAVSEELSTRTWIICDGDIDPEWVEALNSVLDDNHLLTLPSGERIQFGSNVNFIFETHDLKFASPATVSRMGMIFFSDCIDMESYVGGWLHQFPSDLRAQLQTWIRDIIIPLCVLFDSNDKVAVKTNKLGILRNVLSRMGDEVTSKIEFSLQVFKGLYGNLVDQQRAVLVTEMIRLVPELAPFGNNLPNSFWNLEKSRADVFQQKSLAEITTDQLKDVNLAPVVEILRVQRASDNLQTWIRQKQPLLVVGPDGSGKQLTIRHALSSMRSTTLVTLHCSALTGPSDLQRILSQSCMSTTNNVGKLFRPKDSERLVVYLRDVHLPLRDKFGTVQLLALVQQILQYGGFHDVDLTWIRLENVQFVLTTTTVGARGLPGRLIGSLRIYLVTPPATEDLRYVYSAFLKPTVRHVITDGKDMEKLGLTVVQIFEEIKRCFPQSDRIHYSFTPRDLTRLVFALKRYDLGETAGFSGLLHALAHELQRLFADRLVSAEARRKFRDSILNPILQSTWNISLPNIGVLFYMETSEHSLIPVSTEDFSQAIDKAISSYEKENRDTNLIVFPETLESMTAVYHGIIHDTSPLVLIGRSGCGLRECLEVITNMLALDTLSLVITRGYTLKAFQNDLKSAVQNSILQKTKVVLTMEGYQLVLPEFLQLMNGILSSGDISRIYGKEEFDLVLSNVKSVYGNEIQKPILDFLSDRVREYLRIVIVMDSSKEDLSATLEANPSLMSSCRVRWVEDLSRDSLTCIASKMLSSEEDPSKITRLLVQLHDASTGFVPVSPLHFSSLVIQYREILATKKAQLIEESQHYEMGLAKLVDAAKKVDALKDEAAKQSIQLNEKQREADLALKSISDSMVNASDQKKQLEELTATLRVEEEAIQKRKAAVEAELLSVEPLIQAARQSVGEIRSENLSEIRSMRAPPPVVRDVLEGVLRLMGIFDMSWTSMKNFLGKRTIKEEIMNFNARNITPQIRSSVMQLMREKPDSFDEANAKRSSLAAAPLAIWVKANLDYSQVLDKIKPLEDDLARVTNTLKESQDRVQMLSSELSTVDNKVATLKDSFGEKTRAAEILRLNLEKVQATIDAAENLLGNLKGERSRWSQKVLELKETLEQLSVNAAISASIVTYFGGLSESERGNLLKRYMELLPQQVKTDFVGFLFEKSDVLRWKQAGLPDDSITVENVVILKQSKQVPLIVDPTGRMVSWLSQSTDPSVKVEVVQHQDANLPRSIELAVRFGKVLLIENLSTIEPFLVTLLRQEYTKQGARKLVKFGDKQLDVHESFRLILATKNPSFLVPSDILPHLTKLDFTMTVDGLKNQLLSVILDQEKPELERQRRELVSKEQALKMELIGLEKSLLDELSRAGEDILNNRPLIQSLTETKAKGVTITESLEQSLTVSTMIDAERAKFEPMAAVGSRLFFVLSGLRVLNPMYHFNLISFQNVFRGCLVKDESSTQNVEARVSAMSKQLIQRVYLKYSLGLLVSDRITFALQIVHDLFPQLYRESEWEYLVQQAVPIAQQKGEVPQWLRKDSAEAFLTFKALFSDIVGVCGFNDTASWTQSSQKDDPFTNFPDTGKRVSLFQRLLVIKTCCPEYLPNALKAFCSSVLGLASLDANLSSFSTLGLQEASAVEPILLIISPGADPLQELRVAATETVGMNNFHELSMGQGQELIALTMVREAMQKGTWICLQNVHLTTTWLPSLLGELIANTPHEHFRLWLTSEIHPKFPPSLTQKCLKIFVESPPGLKQNLKRIYDKWSPEFLADGSPLRAQSLFGLAWFHTVMQERRLYLPLGWNKFYEFSQADFKSGVLLLDQLAKSKKGLNWPQVHGILGDAIYGGRIDNKLDMRKLQVYLCICFSEESFTASSKTTSGKKFGPGLMLPRSTNKADFLNLLEQLPDPDDVSYFGLAANVHRQVQSVVCKNILQQQTLLHISGKKGVQGSSGAQAGIKWLQNVQETWKKLVSGLETLPVATPTSADPFVTFVQNELAFGSRVVAKIQSDMTSMMTQSPMARDTQLVADALEQGNTPDAWQSLWDGPVNAFSFMAQVAQKQRSLQSLAKATNAANISTVPIILGWFFHPGTFLTVTRQLTARKKKLQMDDLQLWAGWSASDPFPGDATTVLKVSGLFAQGFLVDNGKLTDVGTSSPVFSEVGAMRLGWVPKSGNGTISNALPLPLYESRTRERLIAMLPIACPSTSDQSKWILTGGCLVTTTDV